MTLYHWYDPSPGELAAIAANGGGASPATTTTEGILKLAGDFGGTADSPTVPALVGLVKPYQFLLSTYGAVGDGTTDDTTAYRNCIAAAVAYAQAHNNYAEIIFSDKTYLLSSAPLQGGTAKANAVLPMPMIDATAQKVTLVFRGPGDAVLPLGGQLVPRKGGAVIRCTTVGTNDGTYGEASVIGGPTPLQGGGWNNGSSLFNNMCVIIDGIQLLLNDDPHICGFDFRGMAECYIRSAGVFVNSAVASISAPTQTWQFAIAYPERGNNALAHTDRFGEYGSYMGVVTGEHTTIGWLSTLFNFAGGAIGKSGPHHSKINYWCNELCRIGVAPLFNEAYLDVDMFDYEYSTGSFNPNFGLISMIDDSNYLTNFGNRTQFDKMQGKFRVNMNGLPVWRLKDRIFGGGKMEIECGITAPGDPTRTPTDASPYTLVQPAFPDSAVDYKNEFYRRATAYISGAVTAISVDGTDLGIAGTLAGLPVRVPPGRVVNVTWSGTRPTWAWILE